MILMASGLSLIFGLMDVSNFGHSAFVSLGAFVVASVLAALGAWLDGGVLLAGLALVLALAAAVAAASDALVLAAQLNQIADLDKPRSGSDTPDRLPIGLVASLFERWFALHTGLGVIFQKPQQIDVGAHRNAAKRSHAYHFHLLLGTYLPIKTGNCQARRSIDIRDVRPPAQPGLAGRQPFVLRAENGSSEPRFAGCAFPGNT